MPQCIEKSIKIQQAAHQVCNILRSGEAWRYFVDGPHQKLGRLKYHEKGYLPALMHNLVDLPRLVDRRLTVSDLNALHHGSIAKVGDTLYQDASKAKEDAPGSCRKKFSEIAFGLTADNCSQTGLFDLLQNMRDNPGKQNILHLLSTPTSPATEYIPSPALSGKPDDELRDMAQTLFDQVQAKQVYLKLEAPLPRRDDDISERLQALLDRYYEASQSAESELDKLTTIAEFCREAAQLHPYLDGNGRMFCMQIPYLLCMQNDLPIPMMDQVNKFACFSIDEIVHSLQQGIQKTRQLLAGRPFTPDASMVHLQTAEDNAEYAIVTDECLLQLALEQPTAWTQLQAAIAKDDPKLCPDMTKAFLSLRVPAKAQLMRQMRTNYAVNCSQVLFDEASPDLQLLRHAVDGTPFSMASLVEQVKDECEGPQSVFIQAQYEAARHGHVGFVSALRKACPALDINARACNGETAFIGAARYNQSDMLSVLHEVHAADRHVEHCGFTAFIHAVHNQNEVVIRQMLEACLSDVAAFPLGTLTLSEEADNYMDDLCHRMVTASDTSVFPLMGSFIKNEKSALLLVAQIAEKASDDPVVAVKLLAILPRVIKGVPLIGFIADKYPAELVVLFRASIAGVGVAPRAQMMLGACTANSLIRKKDIDTLKDFARAVAGINSPVVKEYLRNETERLLGSSAMMPDEVKEDIKGLLAVAPSSDVPRYSSPPLSHLTP
ncbi:MAG: Fic family protein [Coxiellaceae bacterium]|nr:Fic family protein [Coxiellaceae bacterium]